MPRLPHESASNARSFLVYDGLVAAGLLLLVWAVFRQVRGFDFIDFDDGLYLTDNPEVWAGLSWDRVRWAFTTDVGGLWMPVVWLSFLLDVDLWGFHPNGLLDAGGFHVTNVVWHAANVLLVYGVMTAMTGARGKSAVVAALFAVHPLHVESVAWVSERKDVLSGFSGLAALWAYVRYARRPRFGWYAVVWLALAMSLMAKQMLVTFPFALLLFDFWPLGRLRSLHVAESADSVSNASAEQGRFGDAPDAAPTVSLGWLLVEKLPLLALSLLFSAVAFVYQSGGGAVGSLEEFSLRARCANAVVAYALYFKRIFLPVNLAVYYPHPGEEFSWSAVLLAGTVLVVVSTLALWQWRRHPYLLVGWLWFLGTLVPVIGLVQVGQQQMADRFIYMPLLGPLVAVVWFAGSFVGRRDERRLPLMAAAAVVVLVAAVMAGEQTAHWENQLTVFRHAAAVTRDNYLAYVNIGAYLLHAHRYDEAIEPLRQAEMIDPENTAVHNNLGMALRDSGQIDEGIEHFRRAIAIDPANDTAHNHWGMALYAQGHVDEAITKFEKAMELDPESLVAALNLGYIHHALGRNEQSIRYFEKVLDINPHYTDARINLAMVLREEGRLDDAAHEFRTLVDEAPKQPLAHLELARTVEALGLRGEAVQHYQQALALDPNLAEARQGLGRLGGR